MPHHYLQDRLLRPRWSLAYRVLTRGGKNFHAGSTISKLIPAILLISGFTACYPTSASTTSEDDLLAVDCLLPGQIRQLGRKTYLGPRRPIKTTASDCSIRGGEYVAYDRASYATALKVWLPMAKEGDIEASVNVGEIYEKGLGLAPDYEAAAHWYRLAAEKGSASAQINLGHLYERGLGVDRDPTLALKWYRMASGLTNSLELDPGSTDRTAPSQEAIDKNLVDELAHLQAETRALREQLAETGAELESANRALKEKSSPEDKNPKPVAVDPEVELRNKHMEADLKAKEDTISALKKELNRHQDEADSLQSKYEVVTEALAGLRTELERNRRDATNYEDQLQQAETALTKYRQTATAREEEVARLTQLWKKSEARLNHQQEQMQRLQTTTTELETEANRYRAQLAKQAAYESAIKQGKLTGPNITMIDPLIEQTRSSIPTVMLRGTAKTRQIIGRLEAPAGLLSLTVNDQPGSVNEQGVFQAFVARDKPRIPVSVIAIDRQGKRDSVEFILESESARQQQEDAPTSKAANAQPLFPPVDFGNYHALVIGIDDYRSLPKLRTAVRDAEAVSNVLKARYGFKVSTLLNASRYDILSALNDLRQRLTSKDNLLIYYAGHGELDKVNMRGHWLPMDAEPGNSANWLSNVAITDILNIINARQILVIADSCYSGSLTRSALTQPTAGALTDEEHLNWLKSMAKKRSRTVLTSGGLEPTLDGGGGGHSVFARALIDVLSGNSHLLEGRELYHQVSARVAYAASRIRFEQVPEYAPIQHTGHEGGDFFLVPAL